MHFFRPLRRLIPMLVVLLSACSGARLATVQRPVRPDQPVAITHVSVFDGEQVLRDQDVLIRGRQVVSVVPSGSQPLEPSARVIIGTGRTLLPGLIDCHVHLSSSGAAPWVASLPDPEAYGKAMLYAGVTSALVTPA